jgi:hypothetical protein
VFAAAQFNYNGTVLGPDTGYRCTLHISPT